MLKIILGILILVAIIIIIGIICFNKFQFTIIKIDEAENNIDMLLQKKLDLMKKCQPIVKKNLKDVEFMDDIESIIANKMDHFSLHDYLKRNYNELFKILDDNEKLYKKKNLISVIEDINENELELVAAIKFYNDNVVIYNQLIMTFPSNILKIFLGYKKKDFYNNEKREIFEILKNK